jgi:hypothetical protein
LRTEIWMLIIHSVALHKGFEVKGFGKKVLGKGFWVKGLG